MSFGLAQTQSASVFERGISGNSRSPVDFRILAVCYDLLDHFEIEGLGQILLDQSDPLLSSHLCHDGRRVVANAIGREVIAHEDNWNGLPARSLGEHRLAEGVLVAGWIEEDGSFESSKR